MQFKDKAGMADCVRHKMCAQCGACKRGQKQAMLMEVQRIGDAVLGDKKQAERKLAEPAE